jgi:hypothetical protein
MPTVLDRPQVVKTRPPALPPEQPKGLNRYFRWIAWLLAAGAVALVVVVAIVATSDDGVVDTPTATTIDAPTVTFTPAAPAPGYEPRPGFGDEATITPAPGTRLVPHAPGYVPRPATEFMEEATVTPGLTVIASRATPIVVVPTLSPEEVAAWMQHAPGEAMLYQDQVAEYAAYFVEKVPAVSSEEIAAWMQHVPGQAEIYQDQAADYEEFLYERLMEEPPEMRAPAPVAL